MKVLGLEVNQECFTDSEVEYLSRFSAKDAIDLDSLWREMDRVWDGLGIDSKSNISDQEFVEFYSHPVWTLSGLFTATDKVSLDHRRAIANEIKGIGIEDILEFGGGFGQLAIEVNNVNPTCHIDICEPHPSRLGQHVVAPYQAIEYVPSISREYELVVAQDVLEHVTDPIGLSEELVRSVPVGGYLIFANCFYPCIKCHLPSTFHLRNTFEQVARPLGIVKVRNVRGAEHAHLYRRENEQVDLEQARRREQISRIIGPILNVSRTFVGRLLRPIRFR